MNGLIEKLSERIDLCVSRGRGCVLLGKNDAAAIVACLRAVESSALDAAQARIAELESALAAQAWVPCSERMPEREGWYNVTLNDGIVTTGSWHPRGEMWNVWRVVAWRPLPAPWEGDANGTR